MAFPTGPLAALSASLTWVLGSSVYALLSRRFSAASVNFNRALVALPLFAAVSLAQIGDVRESLEALGPLAWDRAGWLTASILSSYVVGDVLFFWAALSIGFPAAQAIGATYPVWAALAGFLLLGEPLSPRKAAGMLLAVLGTMLVVLAGRKGIRERPPVHLPFLSRYAVGVFLACVVSLSWAVNSFATGRGGQGMNAAFANGIRMALAIVLCPAMARIQGGRGVRLLFDRADYLRFLPFFVIEAFVGSYVYLYGLTHSSVAVGSTLSSLAPVLAVPAAVVLKWERFSLASAAAVGLVVVGVVLLVL